MVKWKHWGLQNLDARVRFPLAPPKIFINYLIMSKKRKKRKKKKVRLEQVLNNIENQKKFTDTKDTMEKKPIEAEKKDPKKEKISEGVQESYNTKMDIRRIITASIVTLVLLAIIIYLSNTTDIVSNFAQSLSDTLNIQI